MEPEIRYARLGRDRIAYQVVGEGPLDLVASLGTFSALDALWEFPEAADPYIRLAAHCRLIVFDQLGTGSSDAVPLDALPPYEARWREIQAVMDTAKSERAVLFGKQDGGPPAMFGAATDPDRVTALILFHSPARFRRGDDYPIGFDEETVAQWREMMTDWDIDTMTAMSFPSRAGDERFVRWGRRMMRSMATPSAMLAYAEEMLRTDVRDLLPAVRVPTLVIHRRDYQWSPAELDKFVADNISGASYVEVPGGDADIFFDEPGPFLEAITGFLAEIEPQSRERGAAERLMATVLFTDIVSSTERAQAAGDAEWVHRLQLHDDLSRGLISQHRGRVVESTGDGVLAVFDGPGQGLLATRDLSTALDRVGLPIRAGLHTGEVELKGDGIAGIGVHIAARVMAEAGAGEVLVSRTVRDLVVGSEFRFQDRGTHPLKGVEDEWQLYALVGG